MNEADRKAAEQVRGNQGFTSDQQPKSNSRKPQASVNSVAESDKVSKRGQALLGKAAAQDVIADIGDYMAVYETLFPIAKDTAKQAFIINNQEQSEQRESLDADKLLAEIGMTPQMFSEALGKRMEVREKRLSLPSIPQLLLLSATE